MPHLKKKITSHNTKQFLEENLLVFFFNYNHINIQEWRLIKTELSKIKRVSKRVVKNQIATNVIKKKSVTSNKTEPLQKLSTLFQGPTFMIGMTSPQECEIFFNIIKKQKKLIFVGGLYQGQLINHLDLSSVLKGEKLVYADLIRVFQSSLYTCVITTYLIPLLSLLKTYTLQDLRSLHLEKQEGPTS